MQRRTLLIVLTIVGAVLLVLCITIGAAGLVGYRYLQAQRQQLEAVTRQLEAAPSPTADDQPTEPSATPRPQRPTPTPRAEEPKASATPDAAPSAAPPDEMPSVDAGDVTASLVTGSRSALAERPDVPAYAIVATLDPDRHTITGSERVTLVNTEETALDAIYFRLPINAPHYDEGAMTVSDVRVDGTAVEPKLEQDDTALSLPLAQPLAPGQPVAIELSFVATVPTSSAGYGLFRESDGVFMLYNWHPELAVFENGEWLLNPIVDQGDPTNTDVANYTVTFSAPQDFTVVSGGVETATSEQEGSTAHTFVAALTRNFVVVASDQFERVQQRTGDTLVSSYYRAGSAEGGKTALETAVQSLDLFGKEFGPYPYTELDVVEVALGGGAAGMESTGMVMIGSDYYDPAESNPLGESGGFLEGIEGANVLVFTTAHEVAHQWWYGVVGSDAYTQPWLDESLTNWSAAYYVDQTEGAEAGAFARDLFISFAYRDTLSSGDVRLDQPVDAFDSQEYGAIVYGKGALMYDVLRDELGEATFMQFLQRYYREQSFDRASKQEWLATLSAVAGKDMTPFYQKWVEGDDVRKEDLPPGGPLTDLLQGNFSDFLPDPSSAP